MSVEVQEQATLLDLNTRQFDAFWVDPAQPLQVPIEPLHYAAHKYQIILARLDVQAQRNPAQFNSGNYIAILEKLEKLWLQINKKDSDDSDSTELANDGDNETAPPVGAGVAAGVDPGVSADNPFAR